MMSKLIMQVLLRPKYKPEQIQAQKNLAKHKLAVIAFLYTNCL